MLSGDPALVVSLSTSSDSRALSTGHSNLVSWINWLGSSCRSLGTLASLAAATLLWEEGSDPGGVDEVASTAESRSEEEVEEDAVNDVSTHDELQEDETYI